MSQLTIVTTPQNSGLGTPLATAFDYTNSNFRELYARAQSSPPATLVGQVGDVAGMYAYDSTYFYYCFANYTGNSTVWAQVTQVANVAVSEILSGSSNVAIVGPSANVTVGINGTGNVAIFATTGIYAKGIVSAVGNIHGAYILGDGSQLTGLPATYTNANVITLLNNYTNDIISTGNITGNTLVADSTISAVGNITGNYILGNGSQLTGLPATYTNANVISLLATFGSNTISTTGNITSGNLSTGGRISSTGNIFSQGNLLTQGIVSAVGNIVTDGYFVGTFVGNVTGNFVVPGANTQVIFNTTGNADAVGGMTYNKDSNTFTVLGVISSQGNVIGGNVTTAGQVVAAGDITGNNVSSTGNITALGSILISNTSTSNTVIASGNITGGNILTGGRVSATGNVIGLTFLGNSVSVSGSITGASLVGGTVTASTISASGNITGGNIIGTIATANQSLITTVGNLASLSVISNIQGGNINTAGQLSAVGNVTGRNLTIGNVNAGGNIVANVFLATTSSMSGNITGGNILTAGLISATGNVTGNYILGNVSLASGFPAAYSNANVVSLMANFSNNPINTTGNVTAGTLNTIGGITSGNAIISVGNVSVGGNLNASINSTVLVQNTANASGVATGALQVAGGASIGQDLWVVGNIYAGNLQAVTANVLTVQNPLLYLYSATTYPYNYDIGFYSHFSTTGPQPGNGYQHTGLVRDFNDNTWKLFSNVVEPTFGVVTFDSNTVYDALLTGPISARGAVSATGTVTGSELSVGTGNVTLGNIVNAGGNGVGNIGGSSNYFNTVFAQATSAQYADLAEIYAADATYEAGTVVVFGGDVEITVTTQFADVRVAGAISTNPAYIMNTAQSGLPVALRGRIPVKVVGPVAKGDLLVTAGGNPGFAVSIGQNTDHPLAVFAKSIETNASEGEKIITAVIL
jgi:hypothetical protein